MLGASSSPYDIDHAFNSVELGDSTGIEETVNLPLSLSRARLQVKTYAQRFLCERPNSQFPRSFASVQFLSGATTTTAAVAPVIATSVDYVASRITVTK